MDFSKPCRGGTKPSLYFWRVLQSTEALQNSSQHLAECSAPCLASWFTTSVGSEDVLGSLSFLYKPVLGGDNIIYLDTFHSLSVILTRWDWRVSPWAGREAASNLALSSSSLLMELAGRP